MAEKEQIDVSELLNFSVLSTLLTGRADILRKNRVQKKHKVKIKELLTLIEYWVDKNIKDD